MLFTLEMTKMHITMEKCFSLYICNAAQLSMPLCSATENRLFALICYTFCKFILNLYYMPSQLLLTHVSWSLL